MGIITRDYYPRKCATCKKVFYPTPQWVYKDDANNKGHVILYCTYGCMRKAERAKQAAKEQRARERARLAEEQQAAKIAKAMNPVKPAKPVKKDPLLSNRGYRNMDDKTRALIYEQYKAGVKGYIAAMELKLGRGTVYREYKRFAEAGI